MGDGSYLPLRVRALRVDAMPGISGYPPNIIVPAARLTAASAVLSLRAQDEPCPA
jgi:hypothetical protein